MDNNLKQQIATWQEGIERAFVSQGGIFALRIGDLFQAEQAHRSRVVQELCGFDRIMGAFQDFAAQSIDEAYAHGESLSKVRILIVVATLRRFRAAIREFYDGYYFEAASLLRASFENVIYLGAYQNGFVGEWDNWGATGLDSDTVSDDNFNKIRRANFNKLDTLLKDKMRGKESGLLNEEQKAIDNLVLTLHSHVHRTESAMHFALNEWKRTLRPPMLSPEFNLTHACATSTPFGATAWPLLKILPFLSQPNLFSKDWHSKYRLLDEAFRTFMALNGKPIHRALQSLVDKRFTFTWNV